MSFFAVIWEPPKVLTHLRDNRAVNGAGVTPRPSSVRILVADYGETPPADAFPTEGGGGLALPRASR
jgi:hypothetical protein